MTTFILTARSGISALLLATLMAAAQQPPASGQRPRGRPAPAPDDNTGFEAIFDGKTLANWDGDPAFWRAENGAIVGETTADKVLKQNTFIIWRRGNTADFELKLEYRISATGNSGVQYRSAAVADAGKWVLKGYQADIDGRNMHTGMLYEERGRGFLAERGRFTRMAPGAVRKLIGSPGEPDALQAFIKTDDWNQVHIVARGSTIVHVINGHVMSLFVDDDPQGRASEGALGLQLHMGPPMKIEFRNIVLRKL
ncbi:MAG TPA: DUF1080 domain-containing protein [Bryobacteraceae bacterium]|nr:DUF1080 domain-containing protein [Bryobacteraceae bacterium]